jgi:D-arginine dehydrogenase
MTYDFIVIGAGIAGASIGYELAQHGRVCLLEGEDMPGMHATGRSAALFSSSYGGPAVRAITRASKAFFDAPPDGFAERPMLEPRGSLFIARVDQHDRIAKMAHGMRESGGHAVAVDCSEALRLVPLLRKDYLAEAIFDPDVTDIDVDILHQGFLRGARARGAVLLTGRNVSKAYRKNGVWNIPLTAGDVSAPILINAAGAWADEVARACGARSLGLAVLRRTAVLIDPPAGVDVRCWPAVIDPDEQFYFKPDAGKLLLSPADETPDRPCDVQPDELDIAVAVDRVEAALKIEVRRVTHSWAGLRTFAPDRLPVLGFDPELPDFFWCAGLGGYGIQTAPAIGRISASLVQGDTLPQDVIAQGLSAEELSPARFYRSPPASQP